MTFDLKRARELVWAVSERKIWTLLERTGYGGDIDKRRERQAITEICDKQFPSAIAEIERLRGEMENYGDDYVCQMKSKDARIQELEDALEADAEQFEICIQARLDVIDQQAAQIRELEANCIYDPETGKVFVPDGHPELEKLRARNRDLEDTLRDAIQPGDADKIDTFLRDCMCPDSEGPTACCMCPEDTIEFCNLLKRVQVASQQLQAEGKIGPDDSKKISHLRPYEVVAADLAGMLAKSWQITEERKAALWHAINVLKENDIMEEPEEHLWDEEVTVLQAMLTEADHDKP